MTLDEALAIQLLSRLAECSALHESHERTREIGRYNVDELAPQTELSPKSPACPIPREAHRFAGGGVEPLPVFPLSGA